MKTKNDNNSVSYAKDNLAINKDCKHKFQTIYGKKQICKRCGFIKWW